MGTQQRARGRRAMTTALAATVVAVVLTGCGGGDGNKKSSGKSQTTSSATHKNGGSDSSSSSPTADPTETLAQIKGEKDIVVTVTEATRDSGGFVTIEGSITNSGTDSFNATNWIGQQLDIAKSGASVAGAMLVDLAGKKRYYVLRDTDGVCLCTTKLIGIKPGETRPFFAQFPAPPASTTQVQFQLPTMPPANIEISEG